MCDGERCCLSCQMKISCGEKTKDTNKLDETGFVFFCQPSLFCSAVVNVEFIKKR